MSLLTLCFLICAVQLLSGLNIVNITSPINLTKTFIDSNSSLSIEILRPGTMTYYIDPNDNSNTKYVWYGMTASFDSSQTNDVKNDIFTTEWNEYNKLNNLPFTLIEAPSISNDSVWQSYLGGNTMCTSPITNDIFSCWVNLTMNVSDNTGIQNMANIQCKIYFVKENKWSKIINVTVTDIQNIMTNVLCFDDSYFIPRQQINLSKITDFEHCYGTLLDLNGNIIHNEIDLLCPKYPTLIIGMIFTVKGSDAFRINININNSATSTFMTIIYATKLYKNLSIFQANYFYYTNINDTNPINIYNISTINRNPLHGDWDNFNNQQGAAINVKNNCCYISIYSKCINIEESSDFINIYAMITDIYGNNIINNNSDTMLVQNATNILMITPQIIDLSSIYNNYFLMMYGIGTDPDNANTIMCDVYYLEYNMNDKVYSIENVGSFETVKLIYADYGWQSFSLISSYLLSDSVNNNLFISWSQHGWDGRDDVILAQTFQIN